MKLLSFFKIIFEITFGFFLSQWLQYRGLLNLWLIQVLWWVYSYIYKTLRISSFHTSYSGSYSENVICISIIISPIIFRALSLTFLILITMTVHLIRVYLDNEIKCRKMCKLLKKVLSSILGSIQFTRNDYQISNRSKNEVSIGLATRNLLGTSNNKVIVMAQQLK